MTSSTLQARWLGPNEKMTRLKLEGGLKNLLKLDVDWCQFDALWTKLDYLRSGDIDLEEFKRFFGDLSEFESLEGAQTINISANQSKGMDQLVRCLYQVCDQLRSAGFSVTDMFAGAPNV